MRHTQRFYQVRANSILVYELPTQHRGKRHLLPDSSTATYSGKVTPHARRRLLSALDLLVQRSPTKKIFVKETGKVHDFKLNFITLTMAKQENVSVSYAYEKLLREWLRYMKRKQGMKDYVWKAEYQKRGQVHYHVATNVFIPWKVVRWRWNQLQRKAGHLERHARLYKNYDPNGTDIHPMENVEDCLAYIGKEMCKGVQNKKTTDGKIWDCNVELKRGRFSAHAEWELLDNIDDALQFGFASKVESDHCTIIKCKEPLKLIPKSHQHIYQQHIFSP